MSLSLNATLTASPARAISDAKNRTYASNHAMNAVMATWVSPPPTIGRREAYVRERDLLRSRTQDFVALPGDRRFVMIRLLPPRPTFVQDVSTEEVAAIEADDPAIRADHGMRDEVSPMLTSGPGIR